MVIVAFHLKLLQAKQMHDYIFVFTTVYTNICHLLGFWVPHQHTSKHVQNLYIHIIFWTCSPIPSNHIVLVFLGCTTNYTPLKCDCLTKISNQIYGLVSPLLLSLECIWRMGLPHHFGTSRVWFFEDYSALCAIQVYGYSCMDFHTYV